MTPDKRQQIAHNAVQDEWRRKVAQARAEGEAEGRAAAEGREAMLIAALRPFSGEDGYDPLRDGPISDDCLVTLHVPVSTLREARKALSATPTSIAARDAALIQQGREEGLREAEDIARLHAETNLEMAGDSVLADPILHGGPLTQENLGKANNLMVDGCVHSSAYHTAERIADAISALRTKVGE